MVVQVKYISLKSRLYALKWPRQMWSSVAYGGVGQHEFDVEVADERSERRRHVSWRVTQLERRRELDIASTAAAYVPVLCERTCDFLEMS